MQLQKRREGHQLLWQAELPKSLTSKTVLQQMCRRYRPEQARSSSLINRQNKQWKHILMVGCEESKLRYFCHCRKMVWRVQATCHIDGRVHQDWSKPSHEWSWPWICSHCIVKARSTCLLLGRDSTNWKWAVIVQTQGEDIQSHGFPNDFTETVLPRKDNPSNLVATVPHHNWEGQLEGTVPPPRFMCLHVLPSESSLVEESTWEIFAWSNKKRHCAQPWQCPIWLFQIHVKPLESDEPAVSGMQSNGGTCFGHLASSWTWNLRSFDGWQ